MKRNLLVLIGTMFLAQSAVQADSSAPFATESRDASAAYVGTANFIVGRMARECLEIIGRKETPQEYVSLWQKRNSKYYAASATYMTMRLKEAERTGGKELMNKVLAAYTGAVRGDGEAAVRATLSKGEKSEACKRWTAIVDSGAFDFNSSSPMSEELDALVRYFEQ
jgi:hypothetical protein